MSAARPEVEVILAHHHLALGIEPIDAGLERIVAARVQLEYDDAHHGLPRPRLERHPNGRYSLRYQKGVGARARLRVFDPSQRFSPRRLEFAIPTEDQARQLPARDRIRRTVLLPGAAYELVSRATGVRGRIERAGQPVRWGRLVARAGAGSAARVVGRSQTDDRGEFLLIVDASASPVSGELIDPLSVEIEVHGPPAAVSVSGEDPLGDVPLEIVPAPGLIDDVSPATTMPAGFAVLARFDLDLALARTRSRLVVTVT